jgi:hypothetical protein
VWEKNGPVWYWETPGSQHVSDQSQQPVCHTVHVPGPLPHSNGPSTKTSSKLGSSSRRRLDICLSRMAPELPAPCKQRILILAWGAAGIQSRLMLWASTWQLRTRNSVLVAHSAWRTGRCPIQHPAPNPSLRQGRPQPNQEICTFAAIAGDVFYLNMFGCYRQWVAPMCIKH